MAGVGESARGLAPGRGTQTEMDPWRLNLQDWAVSGDEVLVVCVRWHEKAMCDYRED